MSCNVNLDYSNFETLGEIKDKYPDSTLVMRKQFIDIAIQHEWNHGRPVGNSLGACVELSPNHNARAVACTVARQFENSLISELESLLNSLADEMGRLHVRVTFYKEPRF